MISSALWKKHAQVSEFFKRPKDELLKVEYTLVLN